MNLVAAHGLRAQLPPPWEARLYRRPDEAARPVLHLANFALPGGRGDYGTGAVEVMRAQHAFVALVEFGPDEADTPLFAARGLPRPGLHEFAANALQRRLPGQLGCQRFCTVHGRAFCLYVVLGSRRNAAELLGQVHRVLDGLVVEAA